MFEKIKSFVKKVKEIMFNKDTFKRVYNNQILISDDMYNAIKEWFQIFEGNADWLSNKTKSIKLVNFSTAYLSKLINAELEINITGSERADFLNEQMKKYVLPRINEKTQFALVGGQIILKPFVNDNEIAVEFVTANNFYPTSIDITGRATSGIFTETYKDDTNTYVRLEIHEFKNKTYKVTNKAYKIINGSIGNEIQLTSIEKWSDLQPETIIENVQKPLFSCFRTPFANSIDINNPLPVSIFADAVNTIEEIDKMYSDYCYEFHSGKRKVYIDELAFERDDNGKPKLPDKDLYVALKLSGDETKKFFEDYSPAIRENEYQNGLNQLLRIYEIQTGVSSGTYSIDVKTGAVTATQVISEDRATYYTVRSIQESGKFALEDLIYAMDVYATLYKLAPKGSYETIIEYGDSIFEDTNTEFSRRMQMLSQGIETPEKFRMWYFSEDEETARKNLPQMTALTE